MDYRQSFFESVSDRVRLISMIVLVGLGTLIGGSIVAKAAPANDNFLNAQVLSGNIGTFSGTNVDATKQVGEPYHSGNLGGASIWYKFVAPGNGVLQFATNFSNLDTVVAIYTGSSVDALTRVGGNDNDEVNGWRKLFSRVYIGTQAGQTYYIAVDGKNDMDGNGAAEGQIGGGFSFTNVMLNDNFESPVWLVQDVGTYSISLTNVGATKESGEPNHMGNPGGKSLWYIYANPTEAPRRVSITLDSSRITDPSTRINALLSIYKGDGFATLQPVVQSTNTSYQKVRLTFLAQGFTTYHIAIDGFDGGSGSDTGSFTLTYGTAKDNRFADFDQDGKADFTVYRPAEGKWYSRDSGTNVMRVMRWGSNGDIPMLGRLKSGDAFYSVFRPDTGVWFQIPYANSYLAYAWGTNGDVPLLRNFDDGSGILFQNPTVFRPNEAKWWTIYGSQPVVTSFGSPGDIPMLADFTGDANDETVVFRPSNGNWYILNEENGQTSSLNFGLDGDIPVPADYTGDGLADIAIFRPSTGDWWFRDAQTGTQTATHFGHQGDVPQPADYDGDGKADICVFRDGKWWLLQSSNGATKVVNWGFFSDLPVSSPNRLH